MALASEENGTDNDTLTSLLMQRVCYWGSSQQVRGFMGANGKAS